MKLHESSQSHSNYGEYRNNCDDFSGLMRLGVEHAEVYEQLMGSPATRFLGQLPIAATNESLGHPLDVSVAPNEQLIALYPEGALESSGIEGALQFRQTILSDELTGHILTAPDGATTDKITEELRKANGDRKLLADSGVPEYVVFSKYDTSGPEAEPFKHTKPNDIVTPQGHLVTASRETILHRLPELKTLHESIFESQTMQIGYYGGLDDEGLEAIINNPEFMPIAGFDQETGEALMLTLFAPNFTDYDALPWLNPTKLDGLLEKDNSKKVLCFPLVITSKANGIGLFNPSVLLAGQTLLYEHKPDTTYITYESNGLSILYTPKVIHRNSTNKLGMKHQGTTIEATFVTE